VAGIFISYRRADSDGWAGRLRDALRSRFGDLVFQDVDNIPDGEIFADVIDRALNECDVALVIIGPQWGSAVDEKGRRRLDQDDDWVRTETSMVLNRKIRVIPVLVGGARMPRADELPESLRSLTQRQAREIRSTSWDSDVAQLMNHLKQIVGTPHKRRAWLYATPAVVALLGLGIYAGTRYFGGDAPSPPEIATAAKPAPVPPPAPIATTPPLAKAPEAAAPVPAPEPAPAAKAKAIEAAPEKPKSVESPPTARAQPPQPQPQPRPAAKAKPVEPPKPSPPAVASAEPQVRKPPAASRPSATRPSPPADEETTARAEPAPAARPATRPPPERRPAAPAVDADPPAERVASAPPPAAKPAPSTSARSTTINLPNRPPSARELKVGDSWTYKLRDVRFNKELATVTHEIGGGDTGGIRETVRIAATQSDGDSGGVTRTSTQRRLTFEPRIFEQQLGGQAMLFEFAPFMTAFSDVQPGLAWSRIAVGGASESWRFSGKVAGRETVRVPAGSFEAIKANLEGQLDIAFPTTRDGFNEMTSSYQTYSVWFVPEIGRAVKYERRAYNRSRRLLEHEQYELVSYSLK